MYYCYSCRETMSTQCYMGCVPYYGMNVVVVSLNPDKPLKEQKERIQQTTELLYFLFPQVLDYVLPTSLKFADHVHSQRLSLICQYEILCLMLCYRMRSECVHGCMHTCLLTNVNICLCMRRHLCHSKLHKFR